MNESEFTRLLEQSSSGIVADVDTLVAGGIARGRRSLVRRRVASTLGAAITAGACTLAVIAATRGPDIADDPASSLIAAGPSAKAASGPRWVDSDANGPVRVTARPRPVRAIHADIRRMLGPGTSGVLEGLSAPRIGSHGYEEDWMFRFDNAEAQVSVTPIGRGCMPSGEKIRPRTDCAKRHGVEYSTAGPWRNDAPGRWGQTVTGWQNGYEIIVISTNVHEVVGKDSHTITRVADKPTITMDQLISLATSDIWFRR